MTQWLRFAVCNELFKDVPFRDGCREIKSLGYEGIEVAPFTLAESPSQISVEDRKLYRQIMADEGLAFVGLHWLMVSPPGLHVTTPDAGLRKRSWEHVRLLIELCADLGENGVMVFGSPKQRNTVQGVLPSEAASIFRDELAAVAPVAEERGVRILVEALPSSQSDVITTLAQAMAIVEQIASPAVRTMFDTHNAEDETEPHAELIRKYFPYIVHVHVNEMDGREPGSGNYDFGAVLKTLIELQYEGWVSLEVFDFSRDARLVASRAINHLRSQLPAHAAPA